MLLVTDLHSTVAVSCYAAIVAAALAWRRQWRHVVTVFVCVAGGLTLNVLMKLAFQRARPVLDDPLLTLTSYSFPSGHVAGSTLMYGLIVAWTFTRTRRPLVRAAVVLAAAGAIALVAFTRMYLGVHYLSDVAAAFAEGVAWLALCLGALTAFWGRAPTRRVRNGARRRRARRRSPTAMSAAAIVVIVNAGSGGGNDRALVDRLAGHFKAAGLHAEIELAHGGDEIVAAVGNAVARRPPLIVAGGGDGTVSTVAAALVDTGIAFGVLPLGTLNHFAKDLGIPLELADAVAVLARRRGRAGSTSARSTAGSSSTTRAWASTPTSFAIASASRSGCGRGKWPAFVWATLSALRRYPFLGRRPGRRRQGGAAQDAVRLHRQQRVPDGRLRDRRALGPGRRPAEPLRRPAARPLAPAPARAARPHRPASPGARLRRDHWPPTSSCRASESACASPPTAR